MTSAINATKPVDGTPALKSDLRANLAAAKSEIEALQAGGPLSALTDVNISGRVDGDTLVWDAGAGEYISEASGSGVIDSFRDHLETVTSKTYYLDLKAAKPYTVDSFTRRVMTSGTCTAAIQIDGVNVTGLSGLPCTATETETLSSGANSVAAGATVTLVITGTATDLVYTMKTTWG